MMKDWSGKRVLILGAARQGLAAARWLARHGAIVTLNDRRSAEQMVDASVTLSDLPVTWLLGGHPVEALDATDVVCISGGVPLDNPIVTEACRRGIPLTNDTQIFMESVPCPTIGITGSAGKTTTTTLVGLMAANEMKLRRKNTATSHPAAHVGGNIGDPLLNHLDKMTAEDLAILEISSFQLEQMVASPNLAAILNITPNHLDRHGTMEAYTAAKKRLIDFQSDGDVAVLCRDDQGSWNLRQDVRGRLESFGFSPLPQGMNGTYLDGTTLRIRHNAEDLALMEVSELRLRGDHNIQNVLAAFAIGSAAGFQLSAMQAAVAEFTGVAHRLEFVREWKGSLWFNDSIATAPERSMAAIRSFTEPIVLLLGGRDKNLPWGDLAALINQRVDHVILFGEAAGKIQDALDDHKGNFSVNRCKDLDDAVREAAKIASPGDVVLFSPGGTSFDQFKDFEERGEAYRKWVLALM